MLGLPLYATLSRTVWEVRTEIKTICQNTIGPWLARRVPLTQRLWSIKTYFYLKLFHRSHIIPQWPDMISRFQSRKVGGLGLHSIQHKANAMLTSSFLEMAANPCFQRNMFYEAIYRVRQREFYFVEYTNKITIEFDSTNIVNSNNGV